MLKKILIIVTSMLLIGVAYFAYSTWQKDQDLSVWSFIPETSLLVYETDQPFQTYDHLRQQNTWNTLSLIPEVNKVNLSIQRLDSILNRKDGLLQALEQSQLLISFHRIGSNQFDFMISVALSQIDDRNMLSKLQTAFIDAGARKKNRDFLGESIIEIIKDGRTIFAYSIYKQYFIGSTTPYLVEDALRLRENDLNEGFIQQNPGLQSLVKLKQDQGNIYINYQTLPVVLKDLYPSLMTTSLGQAGFLDIKMEAQSVSLDGFSFAESDEWLHTVGAGSKTPLSITEVMPLNASMAQHFSFSDGSLWGDKFSKYLESVDPKVAATRKQLLSELDMDVTYVYQLLDNEIAVIQNEDASNSHQLLVLEVKDANLTNKFLEGVLERYVNKTGDTVLSEQYKTHRIQALPTNQFSYALIGKTAGAYEDCFFTNYRNYLMISDDLPYLKETLDDIENENTWKKSLRKSNFIAKINQEAGYSLFINMPATVRKLANGISPKWSRIVKDNDYILRSFENIAIQFTPVDNKYYTNILIDQPDGAMVSEVSPTEEKSISLGNKITTKPYLIPDHASGDFALILQDETNELYWISKDFEVQWSKSIEGPIKDKIETLDYYKNGKIQYAFVTAFRLHLIDREGKYIPGYPLEIAGADSLNYFSIIDYDGSKDYRFAVADRRGDLYLTNKEGKMLKGWKPKKLKGSFAMAPKHFRISNKDLFLVPLAEGNIHVLNRRSNNYQGFPISTKEFLSGDIYFSPASTFKTSTFTIVTENGNLQTYDLQGKVQEFEQLYKPEQNTSFRLLKDVSESSFLIVRQTENRVDFLNSNLELLFGKDYLEGDQLFIQYYNINPSKQYVIIGNYNGQFVYIYDMSGRLITSRPLIGNQPLSYIYREKTDKEEIYLVNDQEVTLLKLQR